MKTLIYKITLLLLAFLSTQFLSAQKKNMTLKEAIEIASENNKTIAIQKLEEQRHREITKEFKGKLLPNISVNGMTSHYFDRQVIFLPGTFVGTQNPVEAVKVGGLNTLSTLVTLQQPLISKNIKRQKDVAKIDEKIQNETTQDLKSQIIYQVTKEYYGIQFMKNQLLLQEKSLNRNKKALTDAKALYNEGRALKVDTLRSYIAVENLKSSISYLNNNIEVAIGQFKKLIGYNDNDSIELTDNLLLEDENEKFALLEQKEADAITERNDVRLQHLNIEREEKNLSAIKGSKIPEVSLIGQYQLQSQADDLKIENYKFHETNYVGLQVALPIFTGGATNAQVRKSKIKIQQEKLKLEDLKEEANLELKTISSNWKNAKSQLDIQKRTVEAAEINYNINNNRYLNNLSSMLEVNDAELALNTAQLNYLMEVYNLKLLYVEYEKALGLLKL